MMLGVGGRDVELSVGRSAIGACAGVRQISGPVDTGSKELLAHELTHVAQQRAGQQAKFVLRDVALQSRTPLEGQTLQIGMRDATGRTFALAGRIVSAQADATGQDWTIVYEGIQRVL